MTQNGFVGSNGCDWAAGGLSRFQKMGKTAQKEELDGAVRLSDLVPIEEMRGDSKKDRLLLRKMFREARDYLLSFKWCRSIRCTWFGWGVGGVCAAFLFEIRPSSKKVDRWLWVIVGDLPPAYLVTDASPTPLAALQNYVDLMQEWIDTVKKHKTVKNCIPVNVPATEEYANLLQRRLDFLRKEFLRKKGTGS